MADEGNEAVVRLPPLAFCGDYGGGSSSRDRKAAKEGDVCGVKGFFACSRRNTTSQLKGRTLDGKRIFFDSEGRSAGEA